MAKRISNDDVLSFDQLVHVMTYLGYATHSEGRLTDEARRVANAMKGKYIESWLLPSQIAEQWATTGVAV